MSSRPTSTLADGSKRKAAAESAGQSEGTATKKAKATSPSTEDDEWALFQKEVLSGAGGKAQEQSDPASSSKSAPTPSSARKVYALREQQPSSYTSATVEVAPQLTRPAKEGEEGQQNEDELEETEAEKRRRLLREEKEEILSRLEEEQQQQDEADERVSTLKARMERIKEARARRAAVKSKPDAQSTASDSR